MEATLPITAELQSSFPWLSLIVLLPVTGALVLPFLTESNQNNTKTSTGTVYLD